jgi:hypothetical protein
MGFTSPFIKNNIQFSTKDEGSISVNESASSTVENVDKDIYEIGDQSWF